MSIEAIYNRRSIRKYKSQDVNIETINMIIEAGIAAPSGKNRQPWRFIVFKGDKKEELLDKMECGIERELNGDAKLLESKGGISDAKNTLRIMREASVIIMILNKNGKSLFEEINPDERVVEIVDIFSIGAAVENMMLQAENLGIGTLCIANTCYAYDELTSYLNTDSQLVGALALGYADEKPNPRPRKDFNSIVEYRI
ncbi:MAG TPA: nitroreductase [Clostridium sp.]|nr:nitroreductase [Clostridium sp.]